MSGYISSNENRFYVSAESVYGTATPVLPANRIPAVQLRVAQKTDARPRRDKTGSRTYIGLPDDVRRITTFNLSTYMTGWTNTSAGPCYGPLFEAALGSAVRLYGGGAAVQPTGPTVIFSQAHGLQFGQGVSLGDEIRFVAAVADSRTVVLNAPFSTNETTAGSTATYVPATELKSYSVFDYWSPDSTVQRIICGSGIDRLRIHVNADYQLFEFSGEAADVIDSSSFTSGEAGLPQFPSEPALADFDHSIVPGHLGQVWIGGSATQFFTLTSADITLQNGLVLRSHEFGSSIARGLNGDIRNVSVTFSVFAQDDQSTQALYQAARQRSPVSLMFQLGERAGQLCGVYVPAVMLATPEFIDADTRLQWSFTGRAQGEADDELFIAFA